jgi:hypothetical protein
MTPPTDREALKLAREALEMLYAETADYITRNNLGGMNNQCMCFAREALAAADAALAEPAHRVYATPPTAPVVASDALPTWPTRYTIERAYNDYLAHRGNTGSDREALRFVIMQAVASWVVENRAAPTQQAPAAEPTATLEWLASHCRMLGMTKKSHSGLLAHDIALFTVDLKKAAEQAPAAVPVADVEPRPDSIDRAMARDAWESGTWYQAATVDDMQAFYRARLPAIREAAREHGYAIGVHGSERRDFDLIACPWRDGASDIDTLAHAIAMAACGITRHGAYEWTVKPLGRRAVSIPVCWTAPRGVTNDGHIDLSVCPATSPTPPTAPQEMPE